MTMTKLSTVRAVVDALGGTVRAAKALGVGPPSVSNWLAFGYFPDRVSTLVLIRDACGAIDCEVDEDLFGPRAAQGQPLSSVASP